MSGALKEVLQSSLRNRGVQFISAGWIGFIAENLILSENRDYIIENFGSNNYHLVYNTLSSCACGSILYGFFRHGIRKGPTIGAASSIRLVSGFTIQCLGMIGFSQLFPKIRSPFVPESSTDGTIQGSIVNKNEGMSLRCPMDFKPNDVPKDGIYGLDRVSRHPTFWSLGFVSLGQALMTPFIPEIVMFSFPAIFACVGGWHQDQRFLRGSGGYLSKEKYEKTSNIPFLAFLSGKQSFTQLYSEIKWSNASIAIALSMLLHLKRLKR